MNAIVSCSTTRIDCDVLDPNRAEIGDESGGLWWNAADANKKMNVFRN